MNKPGKKPQNPNFSSGPCSKRPGWALKNLEGALVGRSHRSGPGKEKLKAVIEEHRELLGIPADYHIGIVPASDTGAIEMAMWSLLGARHVDVLAWESFGQGWLTDIAKHLKLDGITEHKAGYGELPDLNLVDCDNDVVFVWNGTTSGVRVPSGDWIADDREGLTICDATSAVFAYDLPWEKLDVTTWSWQKVIGGEAAHGMLVLSPRAVQRLEDHIPPWPLPKIFRLTKKGKLNEGVFRGETINTPSMLAVEDCLDSLSWVKSIGGVPATIKRTHDNFAAIDEWVEKTPWVDFLATHPDTRSTTSVCLTVSDPWFEDLPEDAKMPVIQAMCKLLDKEGVAYDIKSYRDAPPGLRIWAGATIERSDIEALLPWLDYAYADVKAQQRQEAAA